MLENMRLALQGIWLHKMRSFLTMLGIIIGIAAIISIVSTIKGTNDQIKESLIGSGNNTVEVSLNSGGDVYDVDSEGVPKTVSLVTDLQMQQILAIPEVESASRYVTRSYAEDMYSGKNTLSGAAIYGVEKDYLAGCGYTLQSGREFTKRDFTGTKKVVVLDSLSATALFPNESAVGQTIEIKGEPFTIIGVVQEKDSTNPNIKTMDDYFMYADYSAGKVFMPIESWPIIYFYDEPQNVVVRAKTTDDMSVAGRETAKILNKNVTEDENSDTEMKYKAADLLKQVKETQQLSASTNRQLIWIASISLLVGGIGVMNIMLVSVTERTREIGLKKAIGAPKEAILTQFLTEASVLSCIGGLLGIISGIAMSQVISKISSVPVSLSIPAMAISVIFSILIGVIFGLFPAVKASKLSPIDALRRE